MILLLPTVLNQYPCKDWYPFCIGARSKTSVLTAPAHSSPFSVYKNYMLNIIILYQNVSCASGIGYLACMRKKSEIIEDYSVI